ncbi:hypothetical protein IEQ34_013684 [Dendrobium chrysotoxum]|uniref:Uncharacterized protein n=1 Tax=Dendrobium chrysotoxum TaxID=161865 RepID=A0AAV7G997_DENCH|nr:hypothetical protein IEQ34_013684 [Dendrobium chrysotoxum]
MADAEHGERSLGEEYTKDGTVDLKGHPSLRSEGGKWTACFFIFASEMFERVAYFGIAPNLVFYLTNQLHQGTVTSANNVTNWMGTTMMTPILGAYIADAYLGRYWTLIISFIIYLLGMSFLTLTVSLHSLQATPCNLSNTDQDNCNNHTSRFHANLFFCSLYVIAVGVGGMKANSSTFGADQFDNFNSKERAQKVSFFNWWTVAIFFGNLFSCTVLVYIQDNVGWSFGYVVSTIMILIAICLLLVGTPTYRHRVPSGSPFTKLAQVFVTATRKWNAPIPVDSEHLFELDRQYYSKEGKHKINHTDSLRFLDKAAVKTENSDNPWKLCPVTQVEETKQMIKLLPVFFVTIIPSVMIAQVLTLFVKQAATLDRSLGPHFSIPPASLSAFYVISIIVTVVLYDRWFVPLCRKHTKNPRGITLLQRIGIGQVVYIVVMIMTAFIERWRLSIVRTKGLVHQNTEVPLTVFALLPQFLGIGFAAMLVEVGKMEFFYDQSPEKMKSLGASIYTSSLGVSYFLSSFLLSIVSKVTKMGNNDGWIVNNLNASHLDYYYGFLVGLIAINFVLFLVVSKFYVYHSVVGKCEEETKETTVPE